MCGEEFTVADFEMACAKCGDGRSTCISGTEAELALENARKIHPEIDTIALSARTGGGLDLWMAWLGALQQKVQHQAAAIT